MMSLVTPAEMGKLLASRVRDRRLLKGWTRLTLAARAGVSAASLKRFETTGMASLDHLLRIAHALGCLGEFEKLLVSPTAQSLTELEQRATQFVRKRGRL
jgi:transcriptional regulator with XRE-family HTH domain